MNQLSLVPMLKQILEQWHPWYTAGVPAKAGGSQAVLY